MSIAGSTPTSPSVSRSELPGVDCPTFTAVRSTAGSSCLRQHDLHMASAGCLKLGHALRCTHNVTPTVSFRCPLSRGSQRRSNLSRLARHVIRQTWPELASSTMWCLLSSLIMQSKPESSENSTLWARCMPGQTCSQLLPLLSTRSTPCPHFPLPVQRTQRARRERGQKAAHRIVR